MPADPRGQPPYGRWTVPDHDPPPEPGPDPTARVRPPREAYQRAITAIADPFERARVIREELAAMEAFLLGARAQAAAEGHRRVRNWAEVARRLPPGPDGKPISRQRAHRIADGAETGVYALTRTPPDHPLDPTEEAP
jgi:hypothetical protein